MKKDYIVVNRDRIIMATCSSREVATEYAMANLLQIATLSH